jgi:hypothetical protein
MLDFSSHNISECCRWISGRKDETVLHLEMAKQHNIDEIRNRPRPDDIVSYNAIWSSKAKSKMVRNLLSSKISGAPEIKSSLYLFKYRETLLRTRQY